MVGKCGRNTDHKGFHLPKPIFGQGQPQIKLDDSLEICNSISNPSYHSPSTTFF